MYAKHQYEKVLAQAWDALDRTDIADRARHCSMMWDAASGRVRFTSLGQTLEIDPVLHQICEPDGRPARRIFQIVALHHLLHAGDVLPAGRETPLHVFQDLMLYHNTIKWRVLDILANAFGQRPELLHEAGARLGGAPRDFGDASVRLLPLPRVAWTAVIHSADDEFPAEAKVLFDDNATHLLPPEDMVVLSELLAHKLANMASGEK